MNKGTIFQAPTKRPRIMRLFEGVSMQLGHDGISKIIEKSGLKIRDLQPGDLVLCINRAGDKLKILGGQGIVLGYLRMPKGHRIMKEALSYIPLTFGGNGFDYDYACRTALQKRLGLKSWIPSIVAQAKAAASVYSAE